MTMNQQRLIYCLPRTVSKLNTMKTTYHLPSWQFEHHLPLFHVSCHPFSVTSSTASPQKNSCQGISAIRAGLTSWTCFGSYHKRILIHVILSPGGLAIAPSSQIYLVMPATYLQFQVMLFALIINLLLIIS